jgi:peptide-methionine (S)-S-oxide reductase
VCIALTPIQTKKTEMKTEVATLGGGCFWCTEAVFQEVKGVLKVEPGYSGGSVVNPSYEQVSTGTTGHAEVVQITFYPKTVTFADLLKIFFETHDPTTINHQGADFGTQYRSVIFHHNDEQKVTAENIIAKLEQSKKYPNPIVTQLEPFDVFYRAEEYHKDYYKRNPNQTYCRLIISPKMSEFREKFGKKLIGP